MSAPKRYSLAWYRRLVDDSVFRSRIVARGESDIFGERMSDDAVRDWALIQLDTLTTKES